MIEAGTQTPSRIMIYKISLDVIYACRIATLCALAVKICDRDRQLDRLYYWLSQLS